jgi:hypothetical protein
MRPKTRMATRTRSAVSGIAQGIIGRPYREDRDLLGLELSHLRLEPSDLFSLLSSDHGEVDHIGGELANGFSLMLRGKRPQTRFDHLGCACHSGHDTRRRSFVPESWRTFLLFASRAAGTLPPSPLVAGPDPGPTRLGRPPWSDRLCRIPSGSDLCLIPGVRGYLCRRHWRCLRLRFQRSLRLAGCR